MQILDIGCEEECDVTIKEWFVEPGDTITKSDVICMVLTADSSITISSKYNGVVTKLYYDEGDLAQTGDPLIDVDTEGESNVDGEVDAESCAKDTSSDKCVDTGTEVTRAGSGDAVSTEGEARDTLVIPEEAGQGSGRADVASSKVGE